MYTLLVWDLFLYPLGLSLFYYGLLLSLENAVKLILREGVFTNPGKLKNLVKRSHFFKEQMLYQGFESGWEHKFFVIAKHALGHLLPKLRETCRGHQLKERICWAVLFEEGHMSHQHTHRYLSTCKNAVFNLSLGFSCGRPPTTNL